MLLFKNHTIRLLPKNESLGKDAKSTEYDLLSNQLTFQCSSIAPLCMSTQIWLSSTISHAPLKSYREVGPPTKQETGSKHTTFHFHFITLHSP